ncbi:flagellar basal-body MS-ring/collar protein FliF [Burkholderia ubonensis]|uniref:flagellar basal-body MS-ring/collar protein FliF n=1 Tax=Burkholderia ubonensis TaxID=101571 RepID=UPI000758AC20|nr:flagellar basal-body MS-ring/collar protein FliF [Burkholderia ubonensis]KWB79406.1 flagellar MS-ring protein [Burkholderia ubonensis]
MQLARFKPSAAMLSKAMPIVVLAIGLTALATVYMSYDDARYKPVFGAREDVSVSDMVAVLDGAHIDYHIQPESGQILVRESDLGRVRMLLAAKGVAAKLPAGLELVEQSDPLGTSQFVQDVRFRRGLEGELEKSIATLDPVQSARVHLAIGKSTSFVISDGDKSAASVVLTLKSGRTLTNEQVAAIVNLVSHSVANLDPANVTVVDQAGDYLSSRIDPSDGFDAGNEGAAARYREATLRSVRDLLAQTVGPGNFKASVTAEIDDDKIEETREQYGTAPKVTDEATREERSSAQPAVGIPGSLSNRPIPPAPPSGASAASAPESGTVRSAQTRQYQYDRDIVQIKKSRGRLKRLSVAVVLNDAASPVAGKPWTPDELARIDKILRNGLGIDSARGDMLVVSSLIFPRQPVVPWWKQRDVWFDAAPYAGYAIGALLVLLFVVRPLLRIGKQWAQHRWGASVPEERRLGGRDTNAESASTTITPLIGSDELPPIGSSVDVLVGHLRTLSAGEPERVAEVIKQWVRKNDRTS